MNEGREYRYQMDWTLPNGKMAHVRCDDWDEFKTACNNMAYLVNSPRPFPDDEGNRATSPEQSQKVTSDPSWCQIHNVTMRQFAKNGKSWYSHSPSEGVWCNGRAK